MNRREFVQQLDRFPVGERTHKGDDHLLAMLKWYFEEKVREDYEPRSGLCIERYLPEYVVDAIQLLNKDKGLPEEVSRHRALYLLETKQDTLPLLTEVGYGGVRRALLVVRLAHLMKVATRQQFVEKEVEAYCFAQDAVLNQVFYRFLQEVGQKGLLGIYEAAPCGCSGTFGQTEIRVGGSAGCLMITFVRRHEGATTYEALPGSEDLVLPYIEKSVTFIGDDSQPLSPRWGIQSCHGTFRLALEMVEEVVASWPRNRRTQKQVFKKNRNISLGF